MSIFWRRLALRKHHRYFPYNCHELGQVSFPTNSSKQDYKVKDDLVLSVCSPGPNLALLFRNFGGTRQHPCLEGGWKWWLGAEKGLHSSESAVLTETSKNQSWHWDPAKSVSS